jgi:hypothetical protein
LQVAVSVRVRVSKVHCVIIVLHVDSECEGVVVSRRLALHRVLIIADISAGSDPAFAICFSFNFTVHERSHPMVIKGVWFEQIDYIEAICAPSTSIRQSKVIPLSESSGIVIRFED